VSGGGCCSLDCRRGLRVVVPLCCYMHVPPSFLCASAWSHSFLGLCACIRYGVVKLALFPKNKKNCTFSSLVVVEKGSLHKLTFFKLCLSGEFPST
jgi:hypothetical protein